jgi:hypothetical protein
VRPKVRRLAVPADLLDFASLGAAVAQVERWGVSTCSSAMAGTSVWAHGRLLDTRWT